MDLSVIVSDGIKKPLLVLCIQILSVEFVKPSKLKRHVESSMTAKAKTKHFLSERQIARSDLEWTSPKYSSQWRMQGAPMRPPQEQYNAYFSDYLPTIILAAPLRKLYNVIFGCYDCNRNVNLVKFCAMNGRSPKRKKSSTCTSAKY